MRTAGFVAVIFLLGGCAGTPPQKTATDTSAKANCEKNMATGSHMMTNSCDRGPADANAQTMSHGSFESTMRQSNSGGAANH